MGGWMCKHISKGIEMITNITLIVTNVYSKSVFRAVHRQYITFDSFPVYVGIPKVKQLSEERVTKGLKGKSCKKFDRSVYHNVRSRFCPNDSYFLKWGQILLS
jgi:hypothetical protein